MPAWIHSAKDNDLLLAMPIPTSMILLVRLSGIYAMGLLYELIVMIPMVLIWFGNAPVSVAGTVHVLLIPLVLSLLILVLSAILGRVVARIAAKVKHQNIITVFVSLVFFAAYYYLSARTYSFLQAILLDQEAVGSRLRAVFYTLYPMGMTAQGRVRSMLVFTVLAVASGITYLILSRSFLALAAGSRGAAQIAYKARRILVPQAAHLPLPLLLHQRYAHYHGRNGVQEKAREDTGRAWQDYLRLCKAGGSRSYLETLHDANLANPFEAGSVERACGYAAEILLAQIAEQNRR